MSALTSIRSSLIEMVIVFVVISTYMKFDIC